MIFRRLSGRPRELPDDVLPRTVLLTKAQIEAARRFGGGNMSKGIRVAIDEKTEHERNKEGNKEA